MYDDMGNVVGVVRIDPEKLPTHKYVEQCYLVRDSILVINVFSFSRVRTKFNVVDPAVDAAQKRLDNMRTGRYLKTKRTPHPPAENKRPINTPSGLFSLSMPLSLRTNLLDLQAQNLMPGASLFQQRLHEVTVAPLMRAWLDSHRHW